MPISLKSLALSAGTASLVFGSLSPAGAFTIFTDRATWQAAVNARAGSITTTDTFSNNIPSDFSITLDTEIVSTNSSDPGFLLGADNLVDSGVYGNVTGTPDRSSQTVTWTFPSSVFAFGADFFGAEPNELTLSGNFDGTGIQTRIVNNTIGGTNGFLGIIGGANFSSIVFSNNDTTDGFNIFQIDNASFATAPASTGVPEPSTVVALAFLGVGSVLSRRRSQG